MEFPILLYKCPGSIELQGIRHKLEQAIDQDSYDSLIAAGYHQTLADAAECADNDGACVFASKEDKQSFIARKVAEDNRPPEPVAEVVEPEPEPVAEVEAVAESVEFDRDALLTRAAELNIEIPPYTRTTTLAEMIAEAESLIVVQ